MINILEIDPVLTVFPYALLYYALLIVSVGLALVSMRRKAGDHGNSPVQIALVIIFTAQLLLLTHNLLAFQGYQLAIDLFPLAYRVLNLICLVWLIFALFNLQVKTLHAWVPTVLTIVFFGIGVFFSFTWLPLAQSQAFNRSWQDYVLISITFTIIILGAVLYYRRHRKGIPEAWLIFLIAGGGFVLYLLFPSIGNLPAVVMLSQLLYYPLLISLANHHGNPSFAGPVEDPSDLLRANVVNAFLDVSLQPNQNQLEKALTHSLSLYLAADLLGLLHYEPISNRFSLDHTYDLIREDHLGKIELSNERLLFLFQRFESGDALLSNRDSDLQLEKQYLMEASGYNQTGNLMLYPLKPSGNEHKWGILGLSPYTKRKWQQEDIWRLERLQGNLSRVLEEANQLENSARQIDNLKANILQAQQELTNLQMEQVNTKTELQEVNDFILQTQSAWTEEVNLWVERQKSLETELEHLQETLEANQENLAEVDNLRAQRNQLEATLARNAEQVAHLKTTMEEAALLLKELSDKDVGVDDEEQK